MTDITKEIVSRLDELNFKIYDTLQLDDLIFLINKNLENTIGKTIYANDEVEVMNTNNSLIITPNNANPFKVYTDNNILVFDGEDFKLNIANIGNVLTSKVVYNKNNQLVEEQFDTSNDFLKIGKKVDNEQLYSLKAQYIGNVKTGEQIFELSQEYPLRTDVKFIQKIKEALSNANTYIYYEDRQEDRFESLYQGLQNRYKDLIDNQQKTK